MDSPGRPLASLRWKRWLKWLGVTTLAAVILAGLGWGWLRWQLRGSLAHLDGQHPLLNLSHPVTVERDAQGVPTIHATNRLDAARALGWVHAQERFFQMDLLRRSAAGELAELFGPGMAARDRWARRHQFRHRVQNGPPLPPGEQAMAQAYTDGVNAGLHALRSRPPEYLLLRLQPRPWQPADTVLAGLAMFFALQDSDGHEDRLQAVMRKLFPPAVADFYLPTGSAWDAAVDASQLPLAPIPDARIFSFRSATTQPGAGQFPAEEADLGSALPVGSNNWGVGGQRSAHGGAIIANDMHLDLMLPHYWFRARLQYWDAELGLQDVIGVTLPGTPAVVVGSNRHLAWSFTDAFLDNTDLVPLEFDPANPLKYRTPAGWQTAQVDTEIIRVNGGSDFPLLITNTVWGPVVETPGLAGRYALRWIAHLPGAVNLRLLELERTRDVATALKLAPGIGIPVENLVVGDKSGAIGYIPIGRLPERFGSNGQAPVSWADGSCGWKGFLPPEKYPRVMNPPGGFLWTANNRVLGTPEYLALHPVGQDFGARARQIGEDLRNLKNVKETDLLEIYRDNRALFLERWRQLLLTVLEKPPATNAAWAELKQYVANWGGRAAPESQGYRLVAEFRSQVHHLVLRPILQRLKKAGVESGIWPAWTREQPVWQIVEQRPMNLLDPAFESYDQLLEASVKRLLAALANEKLPLAKATWGQKNTFWMRHPISLGLPVLSRWLDMPPARLPGDENMPWVQGRAFGTSEQMVVSPGREEQALFHMPGGQSGHFLSPFYRAGHAAWMGIEPTPLLPGPTVYRLTLVP